MFGHRTVLTLAMAITTLSSACDPDPEYQALGSMDITASDPALVGDITTADGWVVRYSRFLVHVSAVEVAGTEGVVGASSTGQVFDFVTTPPKSLLSATVRTARNWDAVSLQIGPITDATETAPVEPVTQADVDSMKSTGASLLVLGQLTKGDARKTFQWSLSPNTHYKDCESTRNGTVVRGLVVPPNGSDTVNVTLNGEGLFSDSLSAGGQLTAEEIAAADTDGDNVITQDEIQAAGLSGARLTNASHDMAVTNLAAFIQERAANLVSSFGTAGKCTAAPVSSTE